MNVPLFDLREQNRALEAGLQEAFTRVLHSGHFILGPEITRFESEAAAYLGVPHAISVSSGTDAILLALMALGIGPGDEVICPSFTFFATAGCVSRVGATPVFVDSCPVCFNLDVNDTARKITPRTRAIIPVHLFGQAAEMDAILALAARHELAVIEDAAQAFSARYRGRACGTMGTFGTYSFFPTKNLGGFGDGGLLVTSDNALAEKARILRVHGMEPKYYHPLIGGNFRMDALQAALLGVKLPHLNTYSEHRRRHADYYTAAFKLLPGVGQARPQDCHCHPATGSSSPEARILLPVAYAHNDHIWNQYTLRLTVPGERDGLRAYLVARGIGAEIYYPVPLHRQKCFSAQVPASVSLPVAEALAGQVLSLPVFPELAEAQQAEVVAGIRDFLAAA